MGYQVQVSLPYPNIGTTGDILIDRYVIGPSAVPLRCKNPQGAYTSGSILRCSASSQAANGEALEFTRFWADPTPRSGVKIRRSDSLDDLPSEAYLYDFGMFFGADCTPPV